jgi:hypothetical protein
LIILPKQARVLKELPRSDFMQCLDSNHNIANLEQRIQEILNKLAELRKSDDANKNPTNFMESEQSFHSLTRELGDLHAAICLQRALDASKDAARQAAKAHHKTMKNKGLRIVNLRFLGGTEISLIVTYYARNCDGRCHRAKGYYPGLILLGIHDGCTSELASEISMACAALSSFEEARHMLENRGCYLNIKTIRNIMKRFSARARLSQEAGGFIDGMNVDGKERRIVVSVDGGRVRIRRTKRGRKTKKNRNRFHTDWREPKLLCIYIADKQGRADKRFFPIIDGAVGGGPDHVFQLIQSYLKQINITPKDKLLFVADGALWIWDRVENLKKALSLSNEQVYELLDFYHAVEHLSKLADLKRKWSIQERKRWVNKQRGRLKDGHIDEVINAVKYACAGSKWKEIERERDYFIKNRSRMEYRKMSCLQFPMGSGAMESTIRRVVNLRLKSPGIFWSEESANEMILLRSYYKAKRWGLIKNMAQQCIIKVAA